MPDHRLTVVHSIIKGIDVALLPCCTNISPRKVQEALRLPRLRKASGISKIIEDRVGMQIFGHDGKFVCTNNEVAQLLRRLGARFSSRRHRFPL